MENKLKLLIYLHAKFMFTTLLPMLLLYKTCSLSLLILTIFFFSGTKLLLNWQNFRRFYLYIMTENMKGIILRHRNVLLSEEVKKRHGLSEHEIIAAATLPELDEAYTRKVHGFSSISELYTWSSSINYLNNIQLPMIFINSKDDPIVPEPLLDPVKNLAGM